MSAMVSVKHRRAETERSFGDVYLATSRAGAISSSIAKDHAESSLHLGLGVAITGMPP
jgi:hypothetical protein